MDNTSTSASNNNTSTDNKLDIKQTPDGKTEVIVPSNTSSRSSANMEELLSMLPLDTKKKPLINSQVAEKDIALNIDGLENSLTTNHVDHVDDVPPPPASSPEIGDVKEVDISDLDQKDQDNFSNLSGVLNVKRVMEISGNEQTRIQHMVQQQGRSVFSESELKDFNLPKLPKCPNKPPEPTVESYKVNEQCELNSNAQNNVYSPTQMSEAALSFWKHFSNAWEPFMKPLILNHDTRIGTIIHDTFHEMFKDTVDVRFTVGSCNMRRLDSHKGHIEMYMSAKLDQKNISYVEALYNTAPTLSGLNIVKFRPFHFKQDVPDQIEYGDFTVAYTDFGVQSSIGFKDNLPVLNIVIIVKAQIADKILAKREVKFISDDGKMSSRDVWLPTVSNAADLYLLNTLGEYNLLYHVGYIEFLHENDDLAKNFRFPNQDKPNAITDLDELTYLRSAIQPVVKHRNYLQCTYCDRMSIQSNIKSCAGCHNRRYCGSACQRADWQYHKNDCKK